MSLVTLFRRHPLISYFALAYGITWGGILLVGGAARLQGQAMPASQFPLIMLVMLLGPSTAGLIMTAATSGRVGLRELGARMRHWRVSPRWYAVALLVNPVASHHRASVARSAADNIAGSTYADRRFTPWRRCWPARRRSSGA